jgi:hypothetical protein
MGGKLYREEESFHFLLVFVLCNGLVCNGNGGVWDGGEEELF